MYKVVSNTAKECCVDKDPVYQCHICNCMFCSEECATAHLDFWGISWNENLMEDLRKNDRNYCP
jgi:hypothetical protein